MYDIIVLSPENIQKLTTDETVVVPIIGGKLMIMSEERFEKWQKEDN